MCFAELLCIFFPRCTFCFAVVPFFGSCTYFLYDSYVRLCSCAIFLQLYILFCSCTFIFAVVQFTPDPIFLIDFRTTLLYIKPKHTASRYSRTVHRYCSLLPQHHNNKWIFCGVLLIGSLATNW